VFTLLGLGWVGLGVSLHTAQEAPSSMTFASLRPVLFCTGTSLSTLANLEIDRKKGCEPKEGSLMVVQVSFERS